MRRALRPILWRGAAVLSLALFLQVPPIAAAADAGARVRIPQAGVEAGSSLDPSAWYEDYRRAVGSDALAGATLGAGVFALLMGLYSAFALARGQRRQRQLIDSLGREPTAAARTRQAPTPAEVLEPMVVQPARSQLDDLDLVIEPIDSNPGAEPARAVVEPSEPESSAAEAQPAPTPPAPAHVPPTPARKAALAVAKESPSQTGEPSPLLDPDADLPVSRSSEPMDAEGRICQCFALLAEGRFEEAVEITGVGLEGHPDAGRVYGQLSRVASLLGRPEDAIHLASRAYRADRSEARFEQLLRLRSAAHRFEPREGERLRRAVAYNPEQPVYLRALGIFEALHGNVETARRLLRTALRHETGEETRGAIARELLQLERRGDQGRGVSEPGEGARASRLQ